MVTCGAAGDEGGVCNVLDPVRFHHFNPAGVAMDLDRGVRANLTNVDHDGAVGAPFVFPLCPYSDAAVQAVNVERNNVPGASGVSTVPFIDIMFPSFCNHPAATCREHTQPALALDKGDTRFFLLTCPQDPACVAGGCNEHSLPTNVDHRFSGMQNLRPQDALPLTGRIFDDTCAIGESVGPGTICACP